MFHCVTINGYLDNCPYLSITKNTVINLHVMNFFAQEPEYQQGALPELAGKPKDVRMCRHSDGHCYVALRRGCTCLQRHQPYLKVPHVLGEHCVS